MMLILKIPIVYLCLVVWWAVRAEPKPPEPAIVHTQLGPEIEPRAPWRRAARRPRRSGPHGRAPHRTRAARVRA